MVMHKLQFVPPTTVLLASSSIDGQGIILWYLQFVVNFFVNNYSNLTLTYADLFAA